MDLEKNTFVQTDEDFKAILANSGYVLPNQRQRYMDLFKAGLNYDEKLSSEDTAVFIDMFTDKIYVSPSGTRLNQSDRKKFRDLSTDALLALDPTLLRFTNRYQDTEKIIQRLKKEYPDYQIVLAGHSLGGSISHQLGSKYNLESHGYSAGSGRVSLQDNLAKMLRGRGRRGRDGNQQTLYHVKNKFDILSASSVAIAGRHKYIRYKNKDFSSHSIRNYMSPELGRTYFDILNRNKIMGLGSEVKV